jgi:hypothetical protein
MPPEGGGVDREDRPRDDASSSAFVERAELVRVGAGAAATGFITGAATGATGFITGAAAGAMGFITGATGGTVGGTTGLATGGTIGGTVGGTTGRATGGTLGGTIGGLRGGTPPLPNLRSLPSDARSAMTLVLRCVHLDSSADRCPQGAGV